MTDKMGLVQEFTYDAHGNVITSREANGLNTHFTYDLLNRLTSVTDPMNNVTDYGYDANGNMLKECYQNCAEISYQYDTENRLTAVYDRQKL